MRREDENPGALAGATGAALEAASFGADDSEIDAEMQAHLAEIQARALAWNDRVAAWRAADRERNIPVRAFKDHPAVPALLGHLALMEFRVGAEIGAAGSVFASIEAAEEACTIVLAKATAELAEAAPWLRRQAAAQATLSDAVAMAQAQLYVYLAALAEITVAARQADDGPLAAAFQTADLEARHEQRD